VRGSDDIADDRLRLVFTCCHPSLASRRSRAHAAHAARSRDDEIARAFLVHARDDGAATRARRRRRSPTRASLRRVPRRARCRSACYACCLTRPLSRLSPKAMRRRAASRSSAPILRYRKPLSPVDSVDCGSSSAPIEIHSFSAYSRSFCHVTLSIFPDSVPALSVHPL
jgi:hypothetical protein